MIFVDSQLQSLRALTTINILSVTIFNSQATQVIHIGKHPTKYILLYLRKSVCSFSSFKETHELGFRVLGNRKASLTSSQEVSKSAEVPKGYLAVYVGKKMKRFVIPIACLSQTLFQELLNQAEEEFGYDHPMGGLTIPCREDVFLDITSSLNRL